MMVDVAPRVCVVDDDPGIRESLRFLFEDAGYAVLEAENGIAALALLRDETRPCVVLLDRMMPRLDGVQTLQRLHSEAPEIRSRVVVLFMTARNDPPDPQTNELIHASTFAIVAKPFDLDTLLATVERAWEFLAERSAEKYH